MNRRYKLVDVSNVQSMQTAEDTLNDAYERGYELVQAVNFTGFGLQLILRLRE